MADLAQSQLLCNKDGSTQFYLVLTFFWITEIPSYFTDVPLAYADQLQIQTHKIILSPVNDSFSINSYTAVILPLQRTANPQILRILCILCICSWYLLSILLYSCLFYNVNIDVVCVSGTVSLLHGWDGVYTLCYFDHPVFIWSPCILSITL